MKKRKVSARSKAKKRSLLMSAQWEKVYRFRGQLTTKYPPPPMRRLRSFWETIEREQALGSLEHVEFSSPLEALIFCIRDGRYPPPEILLSAEECWSEYLQAGGTLTLEEAFIGKPVRNAGNFAARSHANNRKLSLAILLLAISREQKGISPKAARDFAVKKFGLAMEKDTLYRIARSVTDEWVSKVSAWQSSESAAATAKLYKRKNRKLEK